KAHVISGKALAADVVKIDAVETLNGTYPVSVSEGGVSIGGA
ncbi:MAG TPA: fasciclin, partial [Gammaproteobacteria bacterium]|nr:fasciclin [Gammaproteobacteria bacterium]